MASPLPPVPPSQLYSYSNNTSTSTVAQTPRSISIRDARHSPHPSLPAGAPVPAAANILERPINKTKGAEVAASSWAFMFAEIVSYSQSRVDSVADLEKRCVGVGAG